MKKAPIPYPVRSGPSSDDLIALSGFEAMSKQARWQHIDLIESRIDLFQKWQQIAPPGGQTALHLSQQIQALRLKRFQIWNSFYPKYAGVCITAETIQSGPYQPLSHR